MDPSSHMILLIFAGLRLLMMFTGLRRLLMFTGLLRLLIFTGLHRLLIFTGLRRLLMFTGPRRPTGHNMEQLSGSICLYVDLCVCVCVCARAFVWESKKARKLFMILFKLKHTQTLHPINLYLIQTHTHTDIIGGLPVPCTTRTLWKRPLSRK